MAEEQVVTLEAPTTTPQANPFGDSWTETPTDVKLEPPVVTPPVAEPPVTTPPDAATPPPTADTDEIIDQKEWLKREFGTEDITILKAEREEYKKLKETPLTASEIKFADDQSKHIHELIRDGKRKEVRQFLETQERIESLVGVDVSKETADDIIKLNMQLKFKDLSPKEIDYKFNKEYSLPKEPVQSDSELDEDFATRKSEWQERVQDIVMTKIIEAKLAKPELEKAKVQLVLPEINKPEPQTQQPTQESLAAQDAALKQVRDNFLNKLESDFSKIEGFTTKVKDESVEIPVSFKIPDEDKAAIKARLQEGFDVNAYIDKRWFPEGNPNIEQIVSDIFELENRDKVHAGIANNAASQRLVEYIKAAKNPSITNGKTSQQTFDPAQSGQQTISPFSQGAWSEKPPVVIHN